MNIAGKEGFDQAARVLNRRNMSVLYALFKRFYEHMFSFETEI